MFDNKGKLKNKTTYLWKDGICVKSVLEHNSVLVVTTEFDEQGNLIRTMTDYDENQNSAGLPDAEEVYEYIYMTVEDVYKKEPYIIGCQMVNKRLKQKLK